MARYLVPLEIIDRIIQLHIGSVPDDTLRISNYQQFKSLVLVSTAVRLLAIRRFLERLQFDIADAYIWDSALEWMLGPESVRFKETYAPLVWIRKVSTNTSILISRPEILDTLSHLTDFSLSFEHQGFATQKPSFKILNPMIPQRTISSTLTHLKLTSLTYIDVSLLRLVSSSFPSLLRLHLSCTERILHTHCWGCYEESLQCVMHSPIPDAFPTQMDLTAAFAEALDPLKPLMHLHLGIFLSPEYVVSSHIAHANPIDEDGKPYPDVYGPDECTLCEVHSLNVRYQELVASLYFARSFKSLKTIGWSSFFADSRYSDRQKGSQKSLGRHTEEIVEDMAVEEGTTKVWILRADGKVRVRRKPWCSDDVSSTAADEQSRMKCPSSQP